MSEDILIEQEIDFKPGAMIAGRYEVVSRLGRGGMGVVYQVFDKQLDGQVLAMKILHRRYTEDEEIFTRFRNEVLVARSLSHPNVVRTYDFGKAEDGTCYISMEFVQGESLKQAVENGGLPFDEALPVFVQILEGVAYAHEQGVIHRDLKLANIMLTSDAQVKLGDFGTARVVKSDSTLTQDGQMIGTPGYISPEQIRGEKGTAGSDIYALGILAYELVTGTLPYEGDSYVEMAMKQLKEPFQPVSKHVAGVPRWYELMSRKAASIDRAKRFDRVRDILNCVEKNSVVRTGAWKRIGRTFSGSGQGRMLLGASLGVGFAVALSVWLILWKEEPKVNPLVAATKLRNAELLVQKRSVSPKAIGAEEALNAELLLEQRLRERLASNQETSTVAQVSPSSEPSVSPKTEDSKPPRYRNVQESRAAALAALKILEAKTKREQTEQP